MLTARRLAPAFDAVFDAHGSQSPAGVWALTMWTADRAPLFVAMGQAGVELSPLGRVVQQEWEDIHREFDGITRDEFVILADRVRVLVHVAPGQRPLAIERMVGWFKARIARLARRGNLVPKGRGIWAPGYDAQLVLGPDELAWWRRRIRIGLAGTFEPTPDT